jgi:transposase
MRRAREILRLKNEFGLTNRQIASALKMSHVTVGKYLKNAESSGVSWPLPDDVTDSRLMELLRSSSRPPEAALRPLPDMEMVYREMKKKHVTLQLLWEEYRKEHPDGYKYTRFCEYYRRFKCKQDVSLRQEYKAGERMFVDWAGDTITIWDAQTGESRQVSLFVAILGASNYTFARAFENKQQACWIDAHVLAWEFFGGVTILTIPDNEKTGVTAAGRYEMDMHRTYEELTSHYGTVAIPARPRKPQDKAKVESAVLNAQRRILAVLRNLKFFSLGELNTAIERALKDLNERPFQKMPGNRKTLFEQIERSALKPLPLTRYEVATWTQAKANIDYHIQVDWHFYSVPYHLVSEYVEVRLTSRTVEVIHQGKRVALHQRSYLRGRATTEPMHRPQGHQEHVDWTPERLEEWAGNSIGVNGRQVVSTMLAELSHPERGYRACLGLIRIARKYGAARTERACQLAVKAGACSYRSVSSMLKTGRDLQVLDTTESRTPGSHENIRGADYYNDTIERTGTDDE